MWVFFFFPGEKIHQLKNDFQVKVSSSTEKILQNEDNIRCRIQLKIKTLLIVTTSPQHWKPRELLCVRNLNSAVSLKLIPMLY